MSTYVYLVCLDHEPPIIASEESGQHLSDLPRIRAEIADRENVADAEARYDTFHCGWDMDAYWRANSAKFLAAHPKCRIGIRDEYGDNHPTEEEPHA